jgi:hypothetical protein
MHFYLSSVFYFVGAIDYVKAKEGLLLTFVLSMPDFPGVGV